MHSYLPSLVKQLEYHKLLAESAFSQLGSRDWFWKYNKESNSIAVIMRHLSGNMQSRFTDFQSTDGEKIWRTRDTEFQEYENSSEDLLAQWHKGWEILFDAVRQINPDQLEDSVYIRNEKHTVIEALNRQLAHYPYHIGQIIFIAKMIKGKDWKCLSIPLNQSDRYNQVKFNDGTFLRKA